MQASEVKENQRKTYIENHCISNPTTIKECIPILNEIEEGLQLYNAYINDVKFKQFIKLLYNLKERLLKIDELCKIFNLNNCTIGKRIHELELEEYFNIPDSKLELFFMNFLLQHSYQKNIDFKRRLFNLYLDEDHRQQLDFTFQNLNIAFEINDIDGHNIKRKDINYHYNKTLMARDQHNIRLIHLWEWELNKFNWPKISQWILHLLNQSKTEIKQLNAEDLRLVPKSEELQFLNQYSITSYQSDSDICFGIYQNNELIQTLSFKDNILLICLKFNYSISKETSQIIQYYKQFKKLDNILVYVDVSKFTGKTLEDINFKLIDHIEADIINENINEDGEYYQLYNCGYNVYELK